jgi:hypothetical protein
MADNLSLYAENKLLDHLLGTAAFTMPAQVYLVLYPEATTIWGNITHVGLMDSATYGGGNRLMHGPLAAPKQIDVGDAFRIPLADLDTALQ